jgi:hypothetical protein
MNVIEHALDEYLPSTSDDESAAALRAVPLYRGWYGTIFLTTSGEFLFRDEESDPVTVRAEGDPRLQVLALVDGVQRFPILVNLLPARANDRQDCDECGGTGRMYPRNATSWMFCGQCHGLGWPGELQFPLPEVGAADAPYPPFDDALAKFVAFAESRGILHETVFVSGDDAFRIRGELYVCLPEQQVARSRAKQAYEDAARRRLGVVISTIGVADGRLAFYIYGPKNADEAERLMFPDGLKLSVPQVARSIRTIGAIAAIAVRGLRLQSAEEHLK